jgi:hypothetical protein
MEGKVAKEFRLFPAIIAAILYPLLTPRDRKHVTS